MPITEQDRRDWKFLQSFHERQTQWQTESASREILSSLCLMQTGAPEELPLRALVDGHEEAKGLRINVLSGCLETPQNVQILPTGTSARLECTWSDKETRTALVCLDGMEEGAHPEPGSIICDARKPAGQSDMFSVNVLWLDDEPLYAGRTYRICTITGEYAALVGKLKNRIDTELAQPLAATCLKRGEIGQVEIELDGTLIFDTHENPTPLAMIAFMHGAEERVAGVGIIRFELRRASNIRWQKLELSKQQRAAALGQKPLVLWFTGLSGCGKSTVASLLEKRLHEMGKHTYVLDGDNVRHGLCKDLGFTKADRVENMRRVTEVAKLMVDAGLIVLVTFISPFREERAKARASFEEGEFIEIFVDTPLEICEARDVKGLYAKARAGLIRNFTGIDSPYEPPESPEIHLDGARMSTEEMVEAIQKELMDRKLLA